MLTSTSPRVARWPRAQASALPRKPRREMETEREKETEKARQRDRKS